MGQAGREQSRQVYEVINHDKRIDRDQGDLVVSQSGSCNVSLVVFTYPSETWNETIPRKIP
jgi:hypothetical protein